MISDMEYGTLAVTCEAKPGICHDYGECSKCAIAKAYKLKKHSYEIAKYCKFRLPGSGCMQNEGLPCVVSDCTLIEHDAERRLRLLDTTN